MKFQILLFFLLSGFGLSAQTYYPFPTKNTMWTEMFFNPYPNEFSKFHSFMLKDNDTVINGKIYHKLYHSTDTLFTEKNLCGAIREVNKKVYYYSFVSLTFPNPDTYSYLSIEPNKEVMLYDFSLELGDTLKSDSVRLVLNSNLIVEKIDTILIGSEYRKMYTFAHPSFSPHLIIPWAQWVEGIGHLRGLLFRTGDVPSNGLWNDIICFKENNSWLYHFSRKYNKCFYMTGDTIPGQEWAPVGAKWIYEHDAGLPLYLTIIESVKDTTILSKSCRKIITKEVSERMNPNNSYYWDTIIVSKDFIYKSNDTIYHLDKYNNTFYPLYLLNVKVHDIVLVHEKVDPCTKNPYFCSKFEYVVDSLSTLLLQGKSLKRIYTSGTTGTDWVFNRSGNLEKYPIIEKMGSLKYFFGVSRNVVLEGGIKCLRCYTDSEITFKADYWTRDCEYLRPLSGSSSIHDGKESNVFISPNPFNSYINIGTEKPVEYKLYDIMGKLIVQGRGYSIQTEKLESGIYVLKLLTERNETKTIKLLKQMP